MSTTRCNPIPLPCAVLALSVAVCVGSAGPVQAVTVRADRDTQQAQREAIEHLLDAIHLAARKLTDRLQQQAVHAGRATPRSVSVPSVPSPLSSRGTLPSVTCLREALLNLPPPSH